MPALGHAAEAQRLRGERDDFRRDLLDSLRAAVAARGIRYLPGAAELGDFDPASTAIAFAPRGDIAALPPELVRPTYERYWREFTDRRNGNTAWDAYTPYELRIVGTFVRLGWRDRAQALLAFFLADRRPLAWNQWAEVVGRDPRQPRFLGDMPHGWVASDFIRATLDLFAYERDDDHAVVLAAGETIRMPISHGEGRYYADAGTLDELERDGRVVLRYSDEDGAVVPDANPNGAAPKPKTF